MHSRYTAIIHMRDPAMGQTWLSLEPLLRVLPGIHRVHIVPVESLAAIDFDGSLTSLAEIVRVIEDCEFAVVSVAQRRSLVRKAG